MKAIISKVYKDMKKLFPVLVKSLVVSVLAWMIIGIAFFSLPLIMIFISFVGAFVIFLLILILGFIAKLTRRNYDE